MLLSLNSPFFLGILWYNNVKNPKVGEIFMSFYILSQELGRRDYKILKCLKRHNYLPVSELNKKFNDQTDVITTRLKQLSGDTGGVLLVHYCDKDKRYSLTRQGRKLLEDYKDFKMQELFRFFSHSILTPIIVATLTTVIVNWLSN